MKNILIISILSASLLLSCSEDFLDLEPRDSLTPENAFESPDDFEATLVGVYAFFHTFPGVTQQYGIIHYFETKSDNAIGTGGNYEKANDFDQAAIKPWNRNTTAYQTVYQAIGRANVLLDQIELKGAEILSPEQMARIKGEALFLRSFYYFNAVRTWGDIPLVLEHQTEEEARQNKRDEISAIYAQIEADLAEAIDGLASADQIEAGHATKQAAQMMLADVYMNQGKNAQAEPLLRAIVDSNLFTLDNDGNGTVDTTDFAILWNNDFNFAPESIFEVVYAPDPSLGVGVLSNRYNTFNRRVTAMARIIPETYAAFEEGDARRDLSMYFDKKTGMYFSKKYEENDVNCANNVCSKNWIHYRYADVLLRLTEVSGDPQYANMVRERARLAPKASYTLGEIIHERRVELLIESDRWHTLVRTGRAIETINSMLDPLGIPAAITQDELYWPIPQQAIDNNPNLNEK